MKHFFDLLFHFVVNGYNILNMRIHKSIICWLTATVLFLGQMAGFSYAADLAVNVAMNSSSAQAPCSMHEPNAENVASTNTVNMASPQLHQSNGQNDAPKSALSKHMDCCDDNAAAMCCDSECACDSAAVSPVFMLTNLHTIHIDKYSHALLTVASSAIYTAISPPKRPPKLLIS